MIYLAAIVIVFAVIQFFTAWVNFIFRQFPEAKSPLEEPLVSVLIPARNEEKNISSLLMDLMTQDYRNLEIIVFDDLSEDHTAEIVKGFCERDSRIRLLQSQGLPDGWMGKNYACHTLAGNAGGEYFLFLDADVSLKKSIIKDTLNTLQNHKSGLLSLFPIQKMESFGERITVPVMNYILLSLLPLIFVRISPFISHSAANGQFMFFDAEKYRRHLPHQRFKDSAVEDIRISRYYKTKRLGTTCIAADKNLSCRMYEGYRDSVNGFTKNMLMFFGNSAVVTILFWLITTLGIIPVAFAGGSLVILYLALIVMTRLMISDVSRQNVLWNILLIPVHHVVMGVIIFRAIKLKYRKSDYQWKGRRLV
jgi:glycosyltransferase involved in cell wall biosynthesis